MWECAPTAVGTPTRAPPEIDGGTKRKIQAVKEMVGELIEKVVEYTINYKMNVLALDKFIVDSIGHAKNT